VHGLNLKLAPGLDVDVMVRQLNGLLPTVAPGAVARSWMEANQDFLFVIQLEKNMIFFLLTFIILVAAFSVTSSLLISVVRKTREIGLLSAMGGSSTQVACCFAFQALLVGIAGTALGCGLGFMALRFRNEAVGAFTRLTGSEEALLRFYEFSQLPAYLPNRDLATIITLAVAISALAGLIPAWRAARLKPVEALRSE
jgi:lipoprotein-releasing system permease protein